MGRIDGTRLLPSGRGTHSRGHQGRRAWVMAQKTAQGADDRFGSQPRGARSPVLLPVLPALLRLT